MAEWLDIVLKLVGGLAVVLGPAAIWRGHVLTRRTAQEAAAAKREAEQAAAQAAREATELREATARLVADIDALKTRISTNEAGQAVYQAYAEGQAKLVDATREELAAERRRREAVDLREADCQRRLTNAEDRLHHLERQRGQAHAP